MVGASSARPIRLTPDKVYNLLILHIKDIYLQLVTNLKIFTGISFVIGELSKHFLTGVSFNYVFSA